MIELGFSNSIFFPFFSCSYSHSREFGLFMKVCNLEGERVFVCWF